MKTKQIINFLFKFAVSLLILIGIEGILTCGIAYHIEKYTLVGYLAQSCLIMITVYISLIDFETGKLPE
jgi:hypothetical protein